MLQIAQSIRAGRISPSTILRKLGTASRKNKLYFAFRELGRVIRTTFLLEYIGDEDLRRIIQLRKISAKASTSSPNGFILEADTITENVRDDQLKIIKYNHLIANLVIFHNCHSITQALKELEAEGMKLTPELIAGFSPYRTFSSQSLRTVRAERALSTTCGLWDYVWNVGVAVASGRLYAFTKESLRLA